MLSNNPNRQAVPVFIEYDSNGTRKRKQFADGKSGSAKRFYARKLKEGKNPRVVRADEPPPLPQAECHVHSAVHVEQLPED